MRLTINPLEENKVVKGLQLEFWVVNGTAERRRGEVTVVF